MSTDIALNNSDVCKCEYCRSDSGFRVDGGKIYCKTCGREHQPEPLTVKDYMRGKGWLPEGLDEKEGNNLIVSMND